MGPNEKALRELASGIVLGTIGMGVILAILFVFIEAGGIATLFCVRHFGPDDVLKQRCAIFCADGDGVARNTPKITEKYSHYCECNDGEYTYVITSGSRAIWDELLFPKTKFRGWWLPTEGE